MRVKLDENLGASVVALFESAGHDVATVYGQGMASASDEAVYAACCREGRVLVTLDLDFADPFRHDPGPSPGIAVLRVPDQPGLTELHRVGSTLIVRLGEADISGRLWIASSRGAISTNPTPSSSAGRNFVSKPFAKAARTGRVASCRR